MSIRKRPGSSNWWYSFTFKGHRYRGSTGTDDRAIAEIVAAKERHDLLMQAVTGRRSEISIDAAGGRYLLEVAQYQPTGPTIARALSRIAATLGPALLLSELDSDRLAAMTAARRSDRVGRKPPKGQPDRRRLISNATVNRDLELVRRVMRRAADVWGCSVAKVDWPKLLLSEPKERVRHLSLDEERRLFRTLRPDYWPMVLFATLSGLRLSAVISLTWQQVDLEEQVLHVMLKSKEPGGRPHVVPVTPAMAALLQGERGRHDKRVFTYVCERNRRDPASRMLQVKGQRYPFTKNGWRKDWAAALKAAGVPNFRFHDLRHTAATRLMLETGNLKAVQVLLGHSDIATTARYAHVGTADLRRMMTATQEAVASAQGSQPLATRRISKK